MFCFWTLASVSEHCWRWRMRPKHLKCSVSLFSDPCVMFQNTNVVFLNTFNVILNIMDANACVPSVEFIYSVDVTERTRQAGQTDGRTDWNQYTPQQLRCSGGIITTIMMMIMIIRTTTMVMIIVIINNQPMREDFTWLLGRNGIPKKMSKASRRKKHTKKAFLVIQRWSNIPMNTIVLSLWRH